MVTRRCTQRQFLLRPDPETNNAVIYCLAVAAKRYDIVVINFVQMSNHLHEVIYDPHGNAPAFYEDFHKLLAKCMNALRGRWENFFASEQVSVVRSDDPASLLDRLVYVATNPVKDGLVECVTDWPGASGYDALLTGEPLRATRPAHFFSSRGKMPKEVTLALEVPPELGDRSSIVAALRDRVRAFEGSERLRRARTGARVLGRAAVLRQSWRTFPESHAPRRTLSPTFSAPSLWSRLESIQRKREFTTDYRRARRALMAGTPVPFPPGTYWLRRFVGVVVSILES